MIPQSRFASFTMLLVGAIMSVTVMGEVPISAIVSIQLSSVDSTMSSDVQALYEETMASFYENIIDGVDNVRTTVTSQSLAAAPAARLRKLQALSPINTELLVSGTVSDTSDLTTSAFTSQLASVTTSNSQVIAYLLSTADPYFGSVTLVVGSDTTIPVAPVPAPVEAPVPAPVESAPVPTPVAAAPVPSNTILDNPMGVKVGISIATLWFLAFTLGISILLFYPEEKVPEDWKSVTSRKA